MGTFISEYWGYLLLVAGGLLVVASLIHKLFQIAREALQIRVIQDEIREKEEEKKKGGIIIPTPEQTRQILKAGRNLGDQTKGAAVLLIVASALFLLLHMLNAASFVSRSGEISSLRRDLEKSDEHLFLTQKIFRDQNFVNEILERQLEAAPSGYPPEPSSRWLEPALVSTFGERPERIERMLKQVPNGWTGWRPLFDYDLDAWSLASVNDYESERLTSFISPETRDEKVVLTAHMINIDPRWRGRVELGLVSESGTRRMDYIHNSGSVAVYLAPIRDKFHVAWMGGADSRERFLEDNPEALVLLFSSPSKSN